MKRNGWNGWGRRGRQEETCGEGGTDRNPPNDPLLHHPAIPHQQSRKDAGAQPGILPDPILGPVNEAAALALGAVPARLPRLPRHDGVAPLAPVHAPDQGADADGDVNAPDDRRRQRVGRVREAVLVGNVQQTPDAKGDAGDVDGHRDGGKAEVGQGAEGSDQDLGHDASVEARRRRRRGVRLGWTAALRVLARGFLQTDAEDRRGVGLGLTATLRILARGLFLLQTDGDDRLPGRGFGQAEDDEHQDDGSVRGQEPLRGPPPPRFRQHAPEQRAQY